MLAKFVQLRRVGKMYLFLPNCCWSMSDALQSFRGMDRDLHLDDKNLKQVYVTTMFEVIAPRYDAFTRWFSFGMDAGWKRKLIEAVAPTVGPDSCVVDLACGTGDFALALAPHAGQVIGIDAAENMIRGACDRLRQTGLSNCHFQTGDMTRTGLPDGCADVVTVGYGLRNVPDVPEALHEILRLLKPGGVAACLDFTKPQNRLWRVLFLGYLRCAGWLFGLLWHGHGKVYSYIAESISRFLTPRGLARTVRTSGGHVVLEKYELFGAITLLLFSKPRCT